MECARDAHGLTSVITSHNAYIDAFILAVLWPARTESIHLRTSAVLPRDPRPTTSFTKTSAGYARKLSEHTGQVTFVSSRTQPTIYMIRVEHSRAG
jgi:hypothetical protein